MLTDYHVHLRPDAPGTDAEIAFTAANAERYRAVADERGIAELGCSEHVYRFAQALDVWQHPLWRETARDDLDAYVAFLREETDLKVGIEADFIAGREDRMATLLDARPWDYVIGSVHFLGSMRSTTRASTSGTTSPRDPTRSGGATSRRSARPPGPACSTSSATPTS